MIDNLREGRSAIADTRPMSQASLAALIAALASAHRSGQLLDANDWTGTVRDDADAYAVQTGVAAMLDWPATRWKSGGAGPQGPFSHSPVAPSAGRALLGIEAEVALRLDADGAPEAMCIAVECVASRWRQGLDAPALLRMADFQSNAGLLLGPWQPYRVLDWSSLAWRLTLAGLPPLERRGGHSLADPAGVLPAWLRHATRNGDTLTAGTVVTTGAWGGLHPCPGGARGTLAIAGLGEFSFSAAA